MVAQLQYPITGETRQIRVNGIDSEVIELLETGGHGFFTLSNAGAMEQVMVTAYVAPYFMIRRDEDAGPWPANTFVSVDEVTPNPLPNGFDHQLDLLLNRITVDESLVLSRPETYLLQIGLPETGVAAGNYGGMQVDQYGRITYIPPNWPVNALPVFAPGDSGGADQTLATADQIGYTPQDGAGVALGDTVELALQQLDDAVTDLVNGTAGFVESVAAVAGGGIALGGSATDPTFALTNTGITPGTYDGFQVDAKGRVVNYSAPAATTFPDIVGTAPVTATYSGINDEWTIGVGAASDSALGVVMKTDQAEIAALNVIDPTTVPDYTGVKTAIELMGPINAAAATDIVPSTDMLAFYDASALKVVRASLARVIGSSFVAATVNVVATVASVAHATIPSITVSRTGAGVIRVTLPTAQDNTTYHVPVQLKGTGANLAVSVDIVSTTVFDVYFKDTSGSAVATDPGSFSFVVVAA